MINLDADDRDADWAKGGFGWPWGATIEEFYQRLRITRWPQYARRNRVQELRASTPWWSSIPPDLEEALRKDGVLD